MTEEKRYICGYCGMEYKAKEACLNCEKSHYEPREIYDWTYQFDTSYPTFIRVEMSNGVIATYERAKQPIPYPMGSKKEG